MEECILFRWELDELGVIILREIVWEVRGYISERLFIRSFLANAGTHGLVNWLASPCINNKEKLMDKKTYSITAYYKDYMFYEVEASSAEEAKKIALENTEDWTRPDKDVEWEYYLPPIIENVEEV